MYVYMIPPQLDYSFNKLFKLSRLITIAQQFKSTKFLLISLNTQCFSHLSLVCQNSVKIKNIHQHIKDTVDITV